MAIDYNQLEERKNYFFRDSYRKLLNIIVFLLWIGVVMSVVLCAMILTPGNSQYWASTTTGQTLPLHPLSEPIVTEPYVLKWASLLATSVYNVNFNEYNQQLTKLKPYFTDAGWAALQGAFNDSGFIKSLTQNKLTTSAVVNGAPVVTLRAIIHHRYTWVIQLPLLVMYNSANQTRKVQLNVQIRVMRVPVLSVPQGIQCDGFIAKSPL